MMTPERIAELREYGQEFWPEGTNPILELIVEIERLQAAHRWIPVTERLPDVGGKVIFYADVIGVEIGRYYPKGYGTDFRGRSAPGPIFQIEDSNVDHYGNRILAECVTHWMPLPEPLTVVEGRYLHER